MTSKQRCARSVDSGNPALNLTIDRTPDGLLLVAPFIDRVVATLKLEQRAEYAVRLCLEEAVANLVMHGQPGTAPDTVELHVSTQASRLSATIEDHCIPFDPRDVPAPTRPANLDEAKIGGLGIHLMRQYATTMEYHRAGTANRLTLTIERG
jgi:anti-sigma regulatory factor (Ser/Thr protein kinase)